MNTIDRGVLSEGLLYFAPLTVPNLRAAQERARERMGEPAVLVVSLDADVPDGVELPVERSVTMYHDGLWELRTSGGET